MNGCLAGLSVSEGRLILAERDFSEEHDVYRCLNADNGELLWLVEFPARGKLDYGQSPRATPVIHAGKAYLLGAFGDLRCVNLANGQGDLGTRPAAGVQGAVTDVGHVFHAARCG